MRTSKVFRLLPVLALLAGCGKSPEPPAANPAQPVTPPPAATNSASPRGDFSLGQEWAKTMLEENNQAIASMREDLDRIRRELDRLEATPDAASQEELKRAMIEMLDRQESNLRKLHDQATEMREVLAAPAQP